MRRARLKDQKRGEFVFAQKPKGKPPGAHAARAYLRRLKDKARIAKPITPHQLRRTYATNLLNAGAERVDIQALLGHASVATTSMDTHVGPEWMAKGVARW